MFKTKGGYANCHIFMNPLAVLPLVVSYVMLIGNIIIITLLNFLNCKRVFIFSLVKSPAHSWLLSLTAFFIVLEVDWLQEARWGLLCARIGCNFIIRVIAKFTPAQSDQKAHYSGYSDLVLFSNNSDYSKQIGTLNG